MRHRVAKKKNKTLFLIKKKKKKERGPSRWGNRILLPLAGRIWGLWSGAAVQLTHHHLLCPGTQTGYAVRSGTYLTV